MKHLLNNTSLRFCKSDGKKAAELRKQSPDSLSPVQACCHELVIPDFEQAEPPF